MGGGGGGGGRVGGGGGLRVVGGGGGGRGVVVSGRNLSDGRLKLMGLPFCLFAKFSNKLNVCSTIDLDSSVSSK